MAQLSGVAGVQCPFAGFAQCKISRCGLFNSITGHCGIKDIALGLNVEPVEVIREVEVVQEVKLPEETVEEINKLKAINDKLRNDVHNLKSMMGKVSKRVFTKGNEAGKQKEG